MDKVIRRTQSVGYEPIGKRSRLITSFFYALLSFTCVILLHQGMIALISVNLGYDTHFSFAKVDSKPYDNVFWGNYRVLLMYAFPPAFLLLTAALVISRLFMHSSRKVDKWFALSYWWSVSCILYVSSQMAIALIAYSFGKETMYQGIPVLINWFYVPVTITFILTIITIVLNIILGFLFFQFTMQFSPSRGMIFNHRKQVETVRLYYVYPLALCVPLGAFLSLPKLPVFFLVYFIMGMLWVPGLVIRGRIGQANETRLDPNQIKDLTPRTIAAIVAFIILIRIAFFISDYYWYK